MKKHYVILALAAAGLLTGCGFTSQARVGALERAQPQGSAFTQALTAEYRGLAAFEQYQMYDYEDAQDYADKGLAASRGEVVLPYNVSDFNEPDEYVGLLGTQHDRLISALDAGGRSAQPQTAAHAQAMFDCWLEQQEENFQPAHIAACRDEFMAAMSQLEYRAPAPAPAPEAAAPATNWTVYFAWDKSDISSDAAAKIDRAAAAFKGDVPATISVSGYADTSGPSSYNVGLSQRRAEAVRRELIARGVPAENIRIAAYGETHLAVETGDEVRNAQNRRAVIVIVK
jgi:OOP family OmpA-OmpF porin